MNIEQFREFCINKNYVTEEFPFDNDTLVFKVKGKMFALISISNPHTINLKCNPDVAIELRERYSDVIPGYHMNKKLWNTVAIESSQYNDNAVKQWIDNSYYLVVKSMPKKIQAEF